MIDAVLATDARRADAGRFIQRVDVAESDSWAIGS